MAFSSHDLQNLFFIFLFPVFNEFSFSQEDNSYPNGREMAQQESSIFFYQRPEFAHDCSKLHGFCSSPVSSSVYTIKPIGYVEPFEANCENEVDGGAWTVIQRRFDGSINFNRTWKEYKEGFGFLLTEFWLGNDKLSFLTNQALYELRVDITLSNGSSFYLLHRAFRISDEWSEYALTSTGSYEGDADFAISVCPQNKTYGNCICVATCDNPLQTSGCPSSCDEGKACICQEGFLMEGDNCVAPDDCFSNDPSTSFTDCNDVYDAGYTESGMYTIRPAGWLGSPFGVFCNMTIDGGGWTVFQRQVSGLNIFFQNWTAYRDGFGNPQHEFWLGNEKLYCLTQQSSYEIRVDFVSETHRPRYSKNSRFKIDDEENKYRVLDLGDHSGTAQADGLEDILGEAFSTYDEDNDRFDGENCAENHRGGWWYGGPRSGYIRCDNWQGDDGYFHMCAASNLNGDYNGGKGENIFWYYAHQCHIKYTEMKIRRTS